MLGRKQPRVNDTKAFSLERSFVRLKAIEICHVPLPFLRKGQSFENCKFFQFHFAINFDLYINITRICQETYILMLNGKAAIYEKTYISKTGRKTDFVFEFVAETIRSSTPFTLTYVFKFSY